MCLQSLKPPNPANSHGDDATELHIRKVTAMEIRIAHLPRRVHLRKIDLHGVGGRSLSSVVLTANEFLALTTGPRKRSAEELKLSLSREFGYSYVFRGWTNGEEANPDRSGVSRVSDKARGGFGEFDQDLKLPHPDEIDDWGATKKSSVSKRREG
ncbi:hypothetical protein ZIOFF_074783 [Zingiber officinale]|uniref:Uncharacterized protein n=1 Tax=Zingiber officinale TaxID=94328 RepID=A0A8J5E906_ZINOF|nr:hypothetical protein ZIOFF_074783 [Zingiber officinale]